MGITTIAIFRKFTISLLISLAYIKVIDHLFHDKSLHWKEHQSACA